MSSSIQTSSSSTPRFEESVPIILSGPIVRRAEPHRVCIWIATSKPATVKAHIYRLKDLKNSNNNSVMEMKANHNYSLHTSQGIGVGTAETLRLGQRLYLALVMAFPINGDKKESDDSARFPTDEILAYDIEIFFDNKNEPAKNGMRLSDLGLLAGENSIAYNDQILSTPGVPLPTFFLPGKNNTATTQSILLHGSCRKLHGDGEDCLASADELIATSVEDVNKRPRALFLTGDQIYADDVAMPLIQYLTKLGIHLLGWQEHIHGVNKELTEIGIGERQQIVRDHAKFTSQKASNHLLSFGEFAAMYLLAWNPQNWPDTMWDDVFSVKDHSHNNATNKDNRSENNSKIDIYRKQLQQLKRAYRVLPQVRRVLANIPTYMICDDHDITDDWNITKEWYENVKNSDCGKQIVANGLAAFWAFQAWGNNPDLYNQEFVYKITNYLEKDGKVNSIDDREFEDYLWEFHGWSFAVPATTIYPLTIFLDCRTQREYDSPRGAPNLLNDDALHSFLQLTRQANYHNGDPLAIVSQTPVFGFELAEKLQAYLAHISGPYNWDLESWASNERGFTRFITFIIEKIEPRYCVFLSGDVHYGFTMDASFTLVAQEDGSQKEEKRLRAIQLTSSALKSTSVADKLLIGDILDRIYEFMSNKKAIRIGWNVQFGSPKHIDQLLKEQNENAYKNLPNEKLSSIVLHLDESREDKTGFDVLKNHFRIERSPAWMESRRLVKMLGYKHTSVLADNNLGMVIFDKYSRTIEHKLLVRQANDTTKICEAVVQIPSWVGDFP